LGIADRGSYMGLFLGYKPHNENCWAIAITLCRGWSVG
jgi:hypothetical protein